MDVDKDGNAYVALDRRGATTYFSYGRVNADGTLAWAKTFPGGNGDKSNVNAIKIVDDTLYVGARIAILNFDGTFGDGLFLACGLADGATKWSTFHYSGKGPQTIAEHRVKGLVATTDGLVVLSQVWTGNMNGVRYSGC